MPFNFSYIFNVIRNIQNNKKSIFFIKGVVLLLSFLYLGDALIKNFHGTINLIQQNKAHILYFVLLSSFPFVFPLILLAFAWRIILQILEKQKLSLEVIYIYLYSSIFKYLPGNVFHYVNRQIATNKVGVKHKTLLLSNVFEASILIVIALTFSIFILQKQNFNSMNSSESIIVFLVVMMILIVLYYLYRHTLVVKVFNSVVILYSFYLLSSGVLCYLLINYILNINISFFMCISMYSIAWVGGFVIPGAPAGIGVREGIFLYVSLGVLSPSSAIIVITTLRLISTLSEIYIYVYASKKLTNYH